MQFYDATVRLGGNVIHEVPRTNLTAPEVVVLQAIHGGVEAVVNIEPVRSGKIDMNMERDRLIQKYSPKVVSEVFGPTTATMPEKLPGIKTKKGETTKPELTDEDLEEVAPPTD